MLCEECGNSEAAYTVSVLMGDENVTRHLCPACMGKMNAGIAAGNIRNLLSSLMSAITASRKTGEDSAEEDEQQDAAEDPEASVLCERCGTSLASFRKTGRLGCTGCYEAFRSQLQPMLEQIHGQTVHAGRRPLSTAPEQQLRSRRDQLTRLMAQAVAA